MSQLTLSTNSGVGKTFKLNVTQFRSPMSATVNSAATRTMAQHFPIRVGQPDINFTVMFRNQDDKTAFDDFVRQHQLDAQKMDQSHDNAVTLHWPERNIDNWTGYITKYGVTRQRYSTAQAVTFGVMLVDSLMSQKTTIASVGISIAKILGPQIPKYIGYRDTILVRPAADGSSYSVTNLPTAPAPINPGG